MRTAVAAARGDWSRSLPPLERKPDAATSELLAASWLKDALEEHASVAAFARFSMLLLSVSAPPDLVMRSQRASLDEIHHARACFALAERHGRVAYGPSSLSVHDALGKMSLAEIAALTAEEGCVGETLGAALAAEQLAVATDAGTIAVLRKIAVDESRHAELAWRFVAWAARTGGYEVQHAIIRAVERAIAGTLATETRDAGGPIFLDTEGYPTNRPATRRHKKTACGDLLFKRPMQIGASPRYASTDPHQVRLSVTRAAVLVLEGAAADVRGLDRLAIAAAEEGGLLDDGRTAARALPDGSARAVGRACLADGTRRGAAITWPSRRERRGGRGGRGGRERHGGRSGHSGRGARAAADGESEPERCGAGEPRPAARAWTPVDVVAHSSLTVGDICEKSSTPSANAHAGKPGCERRLREGHFLT